MNSDLSISWESFLGNSVFLNHLSEDDDYIYFLAERRINQLPLEINGTSYTAIKARYIIQVSKNGEFLSSCEIENAKHTLYIKKCVLDDGNLLCLLFSKDNNLVNNRIDVIKENEISLLKFDSNLNLIWKKNTKNYSTAIRSSDEVIFDLKSSNNQYEFAIPQYAEFSYEETIIPYKDDAIQFTIDKEGNYISTKKFDLQPLNQNFIYINQIKERSPLFNDVLYEIKSHKKGTVASFKQYHYFIGYFDFIDYEMDSEYNLYLLSIGYRHSSTNKNSQIELVVEKKNELGNSKWKNSIKGNFDVQSLSLNKSPNSTLTVSGFCFGNLMYNQQILENSFGQKKPFHAKFTMNGELLSWFLLDENVSSNVPNWSTLKSETDKNDFVYFCFEEKDQFLLSKYSSNGNLVWRNVYKMNLSKLDQLLIDDNGENIYIALSNGYLSTTSEPNHLSGPDFEHEIEQLYYHQSIVLKLNSNGQTEFVKTIAKNSSTKYSSSVLALKLSPFNKIVIYGTIGEPAYFSEEILEDAYSNNYDYILYLDQEGELDKKQLFNRYPDTNIMLRMNTMEINKKGELYFHVKKGSVNTAFGNSVNIRGHSILKFSADFKFLWKLPHPTIEVNDYPYELKLIDYDNLFFLSSPKSVQNSIYSNSSLFTLKRKCLLRDDLESNKLHLTYDNTTNILYFCNSTYDLIEVFDMNGKLIYSKKNSFFLTILKPVIGNYIVRTTLNNKIKSGKFVISKRYRSL